MMPDGLNGTDFTDNAWDALYDVVDSADFRDHDADRIYDALSRRLKFIPFGEYLKRYIYRKAELKEPFDSIPLKLYQQIIRDAFKDNSTPYSFEPTTQKISTLSKNWLTQQTVNRKVVFLLGFGLRMSVEDVEEFLIKALREHGINVKDPFEVICWYCFKNGCSYYKYEKLWEMFSTAAPNSASNPINGEGTIGLRNTLYSVRDDSSLIDFVSCLKAKDDQIQSGSTARHCFDTLLRKAKKRVAELYNSDEQNTKHYTDEDVSVYDLERIISSAIPVDRNGNLTPSKASKLNDQFDGKRFSRQHINDVLSNKSEVTRFDLITLNFFIFAQSVDEIPDAKRRLIDFVQTSNDVLEKCSMGELYISNPYECFVLMCILSVDPMGTYADVWELSFDKENKQV